MKKLIHLGIFTLLVLPIYGLELDTIVDQSQITSATVYYKGATVHRTVTLSTKGEHIVRLTKLPLHVDRKSITIEADPKCEIKSVKSKFENTSLVQRYSKSDLASLQALSDSIELLNILIEVLDEEYDMITTNKNFENDAEITSVEEVVLASKFYQSRVKALKLERLDRSREHNKLVARRDALLKIKEDSDLKSSEKQLVLYIHLDNKTVGSSLQLSYYHPDASWSPYYDLKAGNNVEKLELYRKAYVSQSTKEDWSDINLTLSTSVPAHDNSLPQLIPVRLSHQRPSHITSYRPPLVNPNGKTGRVIDRKTGEPMIGASVYIDGTTQGTITDIDGQFYFPEGIGKNVTIAYTGYNNITCVLHQEYTVVSLVEGMLLSEVVVTGRGSSRNRSIKKEVQPTRKQIDLQISETLNTLSYKLASTYSMRSGSEPIDVLLKKENLPTLLQYESIPIKSESAYLMAEIKDWHLYNLEPAPINLFIDGTFKGKSTINPNSQDDNLKISLGTDPEVSLSRRWINNKYKKKILSRHKEEVHHYIVTVKNNKSQSVTINIKDQMPISSDAAIVIEPQNLSGGKLKQDTGLVSWKLTLESGESKELDLIYKLKYPKNYDINL